MLFGPEPRFAGLPRESFSLFAIAERNERRRRIVETIHPALAVLGEDLLELLNPRAEVALHAHLPRLDWPRDYQPFCTWLALSRESHGYQSGPQLNVGVHADHVALRLGWDTSADAFGRFEFLCRHGGFGEELGRLATEHALDFRVYAAAPWPAGSVEVFRSRVDMRASFDEVARRGVWWELGRAHPVPDALDHVCSPALGREVADIFTALLPAFERGQV